MQLNKVADEERAEEWDGIILRLLTLTVPWGQTHEPHVLSLGPQAAVTFLLQIQQIIGLCWVLWVQLSIFCDETC